MVQAVIGICEYLSLISSTDEFLVRFSFPRTHTPTSIHTYTYQRHIVGKVHCGENPCVLVGRCGERTRTHTYTHTHHVFARKHAGNQKGTCLYGTEKNSVN